MLHGGGAKTCHEGGASRTGKEKGTFVILEDVAYTRDKQSICLIELACCLSIIPANHVTPGVFRGLLCARRPSMPAGEPTQIANQSRLGGCCRAVFIRAPAILEAGPGVEILSDYKLAAEEQQQAKGQKSVAVAVKSGNLLATAFHPELTDNVWWYAYDSNSSACHTRNFPSALLLPPASLFAVHRDLDVRPLAIVPCARPSEVPYTLRTPHNPPALLGPHWQRPTASLLLLLEPTQTACFCCQPASQPAFLCLSLQPSWHQLIYTGAPFGWRLHIKMDPLVVV